MIGKKSESFVTPALSYGAIEKALGAVFGADSKIQQGALRGRLKHLQRLGLPTIESGKGKKITYSPEQACQWLLVLLMSDVGIDPTVSVELVQKYWDSFLRGQIAKATDAEALEKGNPVFLTLRPRLMSGTWSKQSTFDTVPWVGFFRRRQATGQTAGRENILLQLDEEPDEWLCVRNLTRVMNTFFDHLPYNNENEDGLGS
jgi:hypothetical protein